MERRIETERLILRTVTVEDAGDDMRLLMFMADTIRKAEKDPQRMLSGASEKLR